ncbi:GNAT family N-acetyltransferase [Mucilaginibacter sp. OK098]|uniref:GNAT family N-acetyltransferase n=1 Tax=Mucilaginibacter sp. OK098 TaxID=1855297 RepID=UPI0009137A8D|nr:GNAT family N-acetyltransferase [Mucilaginibacter sp. OK098]SHM93454.1 Acetyltransferase (GNAT) domain-containing protein [Mucilaginibacter sp. OK098]
MANPEQVPSIEFRLLKDTDEDSFIEMIADPSIKEYFEELNYDEQTIRYKFRGLNERTSYMQYWGIFLPDGKLAGFLSLKKSHAIFKSLLKKEKLQGEEDSDELLIESDDEVNLREWLETIKSPYTAEIAIHPNFRRKGIGRAALLKVHDYAASVNLKEIYFEVREDNEASAKLIAGLFPEPVISAKDHYGHDLFRLAVKWTPSSADDMRNELKALNSTEEKKLFNHWRQMVTAIPEITPHRELVMQLFKVIYAGGASIDMKEEYQGCHHINDWFEKKIIISLKKRPEPLTIIWSIAHEYGHLLQNEASDAEKKLYTIEKFKREEDAWKKAEEWLTDKPFFIFNWRDFFRFKHCRLNNYLSLPA